MKVGAEGKKTETLYAWIARNFGTIFVYALSLCIMNGKHVIMWGKGLSTFGFWMYFQCIAVAAVIYVVLTYDFAEMVSIVPFAGGCFGYARCTIGPTLGFITGIMEGGKYVLYTAMTVYLVGTMFMSVYQFEEKWLPVVWLAYFFFIIGVQVGGTRVIWWCWGVLALVTFTIQMIFFCGAMHVGEIRNFRDEINKFDNDGELFLRTLSYANFLFTGIDAVRTCSTDQSNKTVPRAMVSTVYFTVLTAFSTIISARAYTSNLKIYAITYPYTAGFKLAIPDIDPAHVMFLCLPGLIGSSLGFAYGGGRLVRSMACSGLLPKWLATVQKDATDAELEHARITGEKIPLKETKPIMAVILVSVLAYIIICAGYYKINDPLVKIIRMGGLMTCIEVYGMMGSYIVFATKFSGMERGYVSPVGIPGAIVTLLYFIMMFCVFFYFDNDRKGHGLTLMCYFFGFMIYYFVVVTKQQFFSKEEQDNFMKAYVVNANKRRRLISTSSRKSDKNSKPSAVGMIFNNLITNCSKVLPAGPPPGMNVVAVETVEEKPGGTSSRKVAPSPTKDAAVRPAATPTN